MYDVSHRKNMSSMLYILFSYVCINHEIKINKHNNNIL